MKIETRKIGTQKIGKILEVGKKLKIKKNRYEGEIKRREKKRSMKTMRKIRKS